MAFSKCVSCGNGYFEVVEKEPRNSNFKVMFVQCSSCGGVVGVMDFYNIGTIVKNLEKEIENNKSAINTVNHNLAIINENVKKLFK